MPTSSLRIDQPTAEVWIRLQQIETWEGIGGLTDLRDARHDERGNLAGFAFSLDTPLGTIRDRATVAVGEHRMRVVAEAKGFEVSVHLQLRPWSEGTEADVTIEGRSTSVFTRLLAGTLQHTLESGIDRERDRMAERLDRP
jgi:hypothetical protein